MSEQLALIGDPVPLDPQPRPLTEYQQAVYQLVLQHPDGVAAVEAGAVYHSLKPNPHDRDHHCDYCKRDGKSILEALVKKGLARRRRGAGHLLYAPAGASTVHARDLPGPGDLPEGF